MVTKARARRTTRVRAPRAVTATPDATLRAELAGLREQVELQKAEAQELKARIEAATKPPPVLATGWYLCPGCRGVGTTKRPPNVKRTLLLGARYKDHIPCLQCKGYKMVKVSLAEAEVKRLLPISRCPKCGNFYARGGGKPADEPCYQQHAARSHCHWHDLSVPPPPAEEPVAAEIAGVLPVPQGWAD